MRKIASAILVAFISFSFLSFANSEDKKSNNTELNFFTGMFDFSDDKQAAGVLGIQHQNDDLFRKSFLGRLLYAIIVPLVGWVADVYSLVQALGMIGMMATIFGIVFVISFRFNGVGTKSLK